MSPTGSAAARWLVHLPTVTETCFRLALGAPAQGEPWPTSRALVELERLGARRQGAPRVLGTGRGTPILAAHELRWNDLHVDLEARCDRLGSVCELSLTLPSWDELVLAAPDEGSVWELVDAVGAAVGARMGTVGDGEAMGGPPPETPAAVEALLARHLGLLLPAAVVPRGSHRACVYRWLPCARLAVVLR